MKTLKDLVGLPLTGPVGLNAIEAVLYKDKAQRLYHHGPYRLCGEDFYRESSRGDHKEYYVRLGTALKKMCPSCMNADRISFYGQGNIYSVDIKVSTLLSIAAELNKIYKPKSEIRALTALEVYHNVEAAVSPIPEKSLAALEIREGEWEEIVEYLPWFKSHRGTPTAYVDSLKKRLSMVDDSALQLFYATNALDFTVPAFQARPEVAQALKVSLSAEIENYCKDSALHLVSLPEPVTVASKALRLLYGCGHGDLAVVSSAALDYLITQENGRHLDAVKLTNGHDDAVLESTQALYEPEDTASPFRKLAAAYHAASHV